MAQLKFSGAELRLVLSYLGKAQVVLVKDDGIYLCALTNNRPRPVCYAEGYDPRKVKDRGELFDKCVEAVGGDDFAEDFHIDKKLRFLASKVGAVMTITLSEDTIQVEVAG